MICRLCVNTCSDLKSFYDENGHGNELYQTTREYFHPKIVDMEKAKHLRGICAQCFQQIYAFNSFQASVRVAQLKLVFEGIHNIVTEEQHQTSVAPAQISNVQATPTEVVYNEALLPDDKQRNFEDLAVEHLGFSIKIKNEKDMLKDDKNPPVPNNVQNSQGEVFETRPNLEEYPTETTTSYDDEDDNDYEEYDQDEDSKMNLTLPDLEIMDINSGNEFMSDSDHFANRHIQKMQTSTFKCNLCDKCYESRNDLRGHIITEHPENHQQLTCQLCNKNFNLQKGLDLHNSLVHNVNQKTDNPQETKGNGSHACKLCGKQFNLRKGLDLHTKLVHKTQTGAQPYAQQENFKNATFEGGYEITDNMGLASATFTDRTNICTSPNDLEAMELDPFEHSSDKQKFMCHICDIGFNLEKGLALHYKLAHKTSPQPICENPIEIKVEAEVDADVFGENFLQSHLSNRKFVCSLCEKVYNFEKGLQIHRSLAHGDRSAKKAKNPGTNVLNQKQSANPHKISRRFT